MAIEARLAIALGAGLVLGLLATRAAVAYAPRVGLLDVPSGWKIHATPTPYAGWALPLAALAAAPIAAGGEELGGLLPIAAATLLLIGVGVRDDLASLPVLPRLGAEAAAGAALYASALAWRPTGVWPADVALTIVLVLVAVNALNLIDLLDGIAAASASVAGIACGVIAALDGDTAVAALGFALAGACLGFLTFNLRSPAGAFLGDAGSMPLGFLVAALICCSTAGETGGSALLAAPLLLGVPLFDSVYRVLHRLRRGISLLSAGRDSLATHLEDRWGSARAVTALAVGTQAAAAALAVAALEGDAAPAAKALLASAVLGALGAQAIRVGARETILADADQRDGDAKPIGTPGSGAGGVAARGTILLITHYYPPRGFPGSARPAGLAKYMRRLGYRVIVLTPQAWGSGPPPTDPEGDLIRTRDLLASRLNWRRSNMEAYEGRMQQDYAAKPSLIAQLVVPDTAALTWLPFALSAARRLASRERIDAVISTSVPESPHLVALALRRRGIPWVADLRDGWCYESRRLRRFRFLEHWDCRMEAMVLGRADRVVSVSEPISADLEQRLGIPAVTINNGVDPDLDQAVAGGNGTLDRRRHSFVYTGRFTAAGRSIEPLLAALRLLAGRDPEAAAGIEVVIAGALTDKERAELADPALRAIVRHLGAIERGDALALQAEADTLLVVTSGDRRGEASGKLFEYLRVGRPILVLGEQSEAARIVERAAAGLSASATDPEAIAAAIKAAAVGETGDFDARILARNRAEFSQPRMAERMAEVVEQARRATRG